MLCFLVPLALRNATPFSFAHSENISFPLAVFDKLAGSVADDSNLQPEKALLPMVVTELGSTIDVNEVHPRKQLSPMLSTWLGIVIVVSEVQFLNVSFHIFVSFAGRDIEAREVHPSNVLSPMSVITGGSFTVLSEVQLLKTPKLNMLFEKEDKSIDVKELQYENA